MRSHTPVSDFCLSQIIVSFSSVQHWLFRLQKIVKMQRQRCMRSHTHSHQVPLIPDDLFLFFCEAHSFPIAADCEAAETAMQKEVDAQRSMRHKKRL